MARNPRNPTNQIQVELKLLQDDNVRLLKEFGDKWAEGATALGRDIQTLMGQRSGSLPAVKAGGESASTVKETHESMSGGLSASQLHERQLTALNPANATVLPSAAAAAAAAKVAQSSPASAAMPAATPGMMRRALRVAGSPFKTLGSLVNPETADMYGSMLGSMMGGNTGMIVGGLAGSMFGKEGAAKKMLTAGLPLAALGGGIAFGRQNFGLGGTPFGASNLNYDAQVFGNSFGLDPGGMLGTGLGSEAWKATQQAQIEASRRGRWTIDQIPGYNQTLGKIPFFGEALGALGISDPKYNSKQAQEAMALTTAYGWGNPEDPYSSAMQDTMLDYMGKMSKRHPGIAQEEMMKAMEPVRFGTGTFEGAEIAIDSMAEAARSAHMELGVFAEKAGAAAMALHEERGTPYQTALKDVSAFSSATGLPPEDASKFFTDTGMYLDMSRTGKGIYEAQFGPQANANKMRGQLSIIQELGKPEFWQSIQGDEAKLKEARDRLTWWWMKDPEILGGMTPPDFIAMMLRGKSPVDKFKGIRHIQEAKGTDNMTMGLKIAGATPHMQESYKKIVDGWARGGLDDAEKGAIRKRGHGAMMSFIEKHGMFEKGDTAKERRTDARVLGQWIIDKETREGVGTQDAVKVTLDVNPPYNEIFREMIKKQKKKASQNTTVQSKGSRGGDSQQQNQPREPRQFGEAMPFFERPRTDPSVPFDRPADNLGVK